MKKLQIKTYLKQAITTNRRAKLVCLLLAVVLWGAVAYAQRRETKDEEWGLDNIRLSLPE